jgi:hypothetical protein
MQIEPRHLANGLQQLERTVSAAYFRDADVTASLLCVDGDMVLRLMTSAGIVDVRLRNGSPSLFVTFMAAVLESHDAVKALAAKTRRNGTKTVKELALV